MRYHTAFLRAHFKLFSTEYLSNYNSKCLLDYTFRFFYTISEGLNGAFIKPGIHLVDEARDVFLDYLAETSGWEDRVIQIGRKHHKFEVQPHTILNNK